MFQEQFPFGVRPTTITSEVLDFYIARARDERARAIAEFGDHIGAALRTLVNRLVSRAHRARRLRRDFDRMTDAPTA